MKRLFEIVAERDGDIKTAMLGMLGRGAKAMAMSPLRTLGAVASAADIAGGAKKTEQIADHVAQSVARAPRPAGPTF